MGEKPRMGVFVCHCGTNIGGVIDVPDVVEYARGLKDVIVAEEGKFLCSADYLAKIKNYIAEHGLNRVVVACCTPRTHEPIFKEALKEAGLNPYLLEFVSIRELCSWVHRSIPKIATQKAKELVKMGVAKARFLEPAEETSLPVGRECLVIGGGIAGMTAALYLSSLGFKVKLVEKEKELGGLLRRLYKIAPEGKLAHEIVEEKVKAVMEDGNIEVLASAEIEDVTGYIGNFHVKVNVNGRIEEFPVSTIIVATGMREISPSGHYLYGEDENVVTMLELEQMLRSGEAREKLREAKSVVIINCVNSKNDRRGCCSIGCLTAVKNAGVLKKELNSDLKVFILYKDSMNTKGLDELYLREVIDKHDIKLVRYTEDHTPRVYREGGKLTVEVYDTLLGENLRVKADLIVLTTAFEGDLTVDKLRGFLKASADSDRFLQEAHVKLRPLDIPTDGVYICGGARSPKGVREAIVEAMGAAMRAAIPMERGEVTGEGIVAEIDYSKCAQCGLCAKICPFSAIELIEKKPTVIKALCKGCGTCAADCPKDAIAIAHYTDEQIMAQVEAALEESPHEKIIAFCCHWCALGAADLAGVSRMEYPPNVRVIRVMCSGRVDPDFVYRAFELGAAGVLVAGCEFPTCHYINGNYRCRDRMERVRKVLAKKGVDPKRLWTVWLSAADAPKFVETVKSMVEQLRLGEQIE